MRIIKGIGWVRKPILGQRPVAPTIILRHHTSKSTLRQVLQPPPQYKGHVTAIRIDDTWAAELISFESKPATSDSNYRHVLLAQDIFSR